MLRKKEKKLVVTFHTTADAMAMEKACKTDVYKRQHGGDGDGKRRIHKRQCGGDSVYGRSDRLCENGTCTCRSI